MIFRPGPDPLVGRKREFEELQQRLNKALAGESQFVVVSGEAGLGKTRLLSELEQASASGDIATLERLLSDQEAELRAKAENEARLQEEQMRLDAQVQMAEKKARPVWLYAVVGVLPGLVGHFGEISVLSALGG